MRLPTTGEVFQDKYEVHQIIGKGGFATVYRATDLEVGRDVALKVLSPRDGDYPEAVVARFLREARLLAGLQDPHTITMYDFGKTEDGLLFMVFEYVSGLDLSEVLKRRERLPAGEVAHILKQVLYALREAHNAGVFHRDIKPPNLLIYEYMGQRNCVKLLDFGVAKPVESHPLGPGNLTRKGAMVGTPRYMAPEQIYGRELTPAADIYSLGLVAYEMLTGRPAMDAKTNKERVRQQISEDRTVVPSDVGTPELRRVINRMVLKEPEDRFQTANEALVALRGGNSESERQRPRRPRVPTPSENDTIDENAMAKPRLSPSVVRVLLIGLGTTAAGLALVLGLTLLGRGGAQSAPPTLPPGLVELGSPSEPAPRIVIGAPEETTPTPVPLEPKSKVGCGGEGVEVGMRSGETTIDLLRSDWVRYVPKGYDPQVRYPVVMMFHNMFAKPAAFIESTDMPRLADEKGFVILATETKSRWKHTDDYEVLTRALETLREEVCVDDSRLYAIGHGRGGWFARDLGCYMPLSAIAITGSGQHADEKPCRPVPPIPTIRLFGLTDQLIPVQGGAGCIGTGDYLSAAAIDAGWADANDCHAPLVTWASHPNGACTLRQCGESARYVSCALQGGHGWPNAPPSVAPPNCHTAPAEFPYRDTIWRFFEQEGRRL